MKKISTLILIFSLSILAVPFSANAKTIEPTSISSTPKEVPAEVKTMLNRLEEIKEMDKSDLSRVEKKELRNEVKTIKKALKASGNGVYLSIGAIIIIVLLLILLL